MNDKPRPGSDEAVKDGCSCPISDNASGRGYLGLGIDWIVSGDCSLHAALIKVGSECREERKYDSTARRFVEVA